MTTIRITEIQAKEGKADALLALIEEQVPGMRSADGCRALRVLRHAEDASRFTVVEEWDSAETHRAALKSISPAVAVRAWPLIARKPAGESFVDSGL